MHKKILRSVGLFVIAVSSVLFAGFVWFTQTIDPTLPASLKNADAIVVVTAKRQGLHKPWTFWHLEKAIDY